MIERTCNTGRNRRSPGRRSLSNKENKGATTVDKKIRLVSNIRSNTAFLNDWFKSRAPNGICCSQVSIWPLQSQHKTSPSNNRPLWRGSWTNEWVAGRRGRRTMLVDKGDGNVKRDAIDADAKQYHIDLRWYLVKIYFVKSLKYYGYIEVSCQKLN